MNKKRIVKNVVITLVFKGLDHYLESKKTELMALREIGELLEQNEETVELRESMIEAGVPKNAATIATMKYLNKQNQKNNG